MPSISISRESDTRIKADITVNAEEIKPAEELAIKKISAQAEIKGFRKGKAPAHLVRQKFGPDIKFETLLELVDIHWPDIEKKIEDRIYRLVRVENVQEKGEKMSFVLKLDLQPYAKIGKLKVAQLVRHFPAIDDADVEQEIQDRLLRFAEFIEADASAGAEKNDKLIVDFEVWIDDAPSGEVQKDFKFTLGSGALSHALEQQIIERKGKVGEEFKLRKDLAAEADNNARSYEIIATIKKIEKPKLPDLTDAFVAENFRGVSSIAEWRKKVRTDLERRFESALIQREAEKALKILEGHAQFFFSESFLDERLEEFLKERSINRNDLSPQQIDNLRKSLGEREKYGILVRQLLREAERNYQKRKKTNLTYMEIFRQFVRNEILADEEPERADVIFAQLSSAIDALINNEEENSPWMSVVSTYLKIFSRKFLFEYFDDEGIVKKGKKLTYRELARYLAENPSDKE